MKRLFAATAVLFYLVSLAFAQTNTIEIIPKPQSIKLSNGVFKLDKKTTIVATDENGRRLAEFLNGYLAENYGFRLRVSTEPRDDKMIKFSPANIDAYLLEVTDQWISIAGRNSELFYGLQSLIQLIPIEKSNRLLIPNVKIFDRPRFSYRGMHLDVARHFQPVEFVKKYIDLLAQYKFNYFHWHLTDDQGWRIEIKKYPKLTEVGSKRPETHLGAYTTTFKGDGIPHGGFYTQEQIKDVVAYAKARYITVIPEIEMPGHASAALAAYPQLGCKENYNYKVQMTWGIFPEVSCPTDATFKFLEDVLDETIKLFPDSPYIHIGGDEVLKDHWKESAFVQELKKRENLKDEHEVQSYFIRRIEKFINSRGKKIIGWDEILEGGIAPNATIMSWRGMKGGIEAAKARHDVIMTPTDYVYFDYGQGDPAYEPLNIGSYVPLEKVYSFEPVPPDLSADEAKHILGGQANIWTEYLKTPQAVEYMAFPRMLALSEVLWSKKEDRNFADFQRRLNAVLSQLDKQGVNYRIPEPGGLKNMIVGGDGKANIELSPARGTKVHYTLDGTTPDLSSKIYEKPLEVVLKEGEVATLKTIVVNGAGRSSVVYAATLIRRDMLPAIQPTGQTPGATFGISSGHSVIVTGETKTIILSQFLSDAPEGSIGRAMKKSIEQKLPFQVTFDGYLKVPVDGIYELQVDSNWESTLGLDDQKLIDDKGAKDRSVKSTIIPLKAGWHKLSLRYQSPGGDPWLRVRYGVKGQGLRQIGGGELVH